MKCINCGKKIRYSTSILSWVHMKGNCWCSDGKDIAKPNRENDKVKI